MGKKKLNQLQPGIALYLRVSSDDRQNPDNSFEYQRQRIMSAVDRSNLNLPILREYQDILSGTNSRRPGYQQMLHDARQGLFSHIAVYSIDRIGRSSDETLTIAREMLELGLDIIVADAPNMELSTPSGALFLGMRAVFAQFEVAMLSQRVHDTKRSILLGGGWPSSVVPDGYVRKREQRMGKKYSFLIQDPERSRIIREAWDLLLTEQLTMKDICEELQKRGYTRKSGLPWVEINPKTGNRKPSISQLHAIFHNPFYLGWVVSDKYDIRRGDIQGHWEPLVTEEEYDRGIEILRQHDENKNRKRKNPYLLTGLLHMEPDS